MWGKGVHVNMLCGKAVNGIVKVFGGAAGGISKKKNPFFSF